MKKETLDFANELQKVSAYYKGLLNTSFSDGKSKMDRNSSYARTIKQVKTEFDNQIQNRLNALNEFFNQLNDTTPVTNEEVTLIDGKVNWIYDLILGKKETFIDDVQLVQVLKSESKKIDPIDPICPSDHKFGVDNDKYPSCEDCPLWDKCIDEDGL
jgi:hypothetical protein